MIQEGDWVKIRSWKSMEKEFGLTSGGDINCMPMFNQYMKPLCGLVCKVLEVDVPYRYFRLGENPRFIALGGDRWSILPYMVRKVRYDI